MQALCFSAKRTNRRTLFFAAPELSTESTHAAYLKSTIHGVLLTTNPTAKYSRNYSCPTSHMTPTCDLAQVDKSEDQQGNPVDKTQNSP